VLRVHADRVARCDAKQLAVKTVNLPKKAAVPRRHLAGLVGVRIVVRINVPPFCRYLADGVHALIQQLPERFAVRRTRKTAGEPDHGHRVRPTGATAFSFRLGSGARPQPVSEVPRQLRHARVIEGHGGRQRHVVAKLALQAFAEFHSPQ
jgi:hypothetical protein